MNAVLAFRAVPGADSQSSALPSDPEDVHRFLARFNHERLALGGSDADWRADLARDYEGRLLEGMMLEAARSEVADRAAEAPSDPDGFVAWFESLEAAGPGQNDPLFPWLAEAASLADMRWFLVQEVAGEAGFDDLVAHVQVKMPVQAKLELARNYWDEMGRGNPKGMHGPMLDRLARHLNLEPTIEGTVWESLALANTMVGLALNRRYAYQAIGALGVIELTAPGRSAHVAAGLRRLGVPAKQRHYFELHAVLDRKHSAAWNAEVLRPLVGSDSNAARGIAEGALIRLTCGARCFERYRRHLWTRP
jgi:hypothetical protein